MRFMIASFLVAFAPASLAAVPLFDEISGQASTASEPDERLVALNSDLFDGDAEVFRLHLSGFPGAEYRTLDRVSRPSGVEVWRGELVGAGVEGYRGHLVRTEAGQVSGALNGPRGRYEIRSNPDGEGKRIWFEAHESPETTDGVGCATEDHPAHEGDHASAPSHPASPSSPKSPASAEDPVTLRVVVGVGSAEYPALGQSGVEARALDWVEYTNGALADSGVHVDIELASVFPVHAYSDAHYLYDTSGDWPIIQGWGRLRGGSMTYLSDDSTVSESLRALEVVRQEALNQQAHLMALAIYLDNEGGPCGVATRGGDLRDDDPRWLPASGGSLTDLRCSNSRQIFAHEIGHNMGAIHGPEAGGVFGFSAGYKFSQNSGGTIMAQIWPKADVFSNPENDCDGEPCGIEESNDFSRATNKAGPRMEVMNEKGLDLGERSPLPFISLGFHERLGDQLEAVVSYENHFGTRVTSRLLDSYGEVVSEVPAQHIALSRFSFERSRSAFIETPRHLEPGEYRVEVTSDDDPSLSFDYPVLLEHGEPSMSFSVRRYWDDDDRWAAYQNGGIVDLTYSWTGNQDVDVAFEVIDSESGELAFEKQWEIPRYMSGRNEDFGEGLAIDGLECGSEYEVTAVFENDSGSYSRSWPSILETEPCDEQPVASVSASGISFEGGQVQVDYQVDGEMPDQFLVNRIFKGLSYAEYYEASSSGTLELGTYHCDERHDIRIIPMVGDRFGETVKLSDTAPACSRGAIQWTDTEFEAGALDAFAKVTLERVGGLDGQAQVLIQAHDGSAVTPDHYSPLNKVVRFDSHKDSRQTIRLPILRRPNADEDLSFEVSVSNFEGPFKIDIGDNDTAEIIMQADDGEQSPRADLQYSCDGRSCEFDGSASRNASAYEWDLGGTNHSGEQVEHTFSSYGVKTVSLSVEGPLNLVDRTEVDITLEDSDDSDEGGNDDDSGDDSSGDSDSSSSSGGCSLGQQGVTDPTLALLMLLALGLLSRRPISIK